MWPCLSICHCKEKKNQVFVLIVFYSFFYFWKKLPNVFCYKMQLQRYTVDFTGNQIQTIMKNKTMKNVMYHKSRGNNVCLQGKCQIRINWTVTLISVCSLIFDSMIKIILVILRSLNLSKEQTGPIWQGMFGCIFTEKYANVINSISFFNNKVCVIVKESSAYSNCTSKLSEVPNFL